MSTFCYLGALCSRFPPKWKDSFFKEVESYTCFVLWKSKSLKQSTWAVRLRLKLCTWAPRHSVAFLLPGTQQQTPLCVRHFIVSMLQFWTWLSLLRKANDRMQVWCSLCSHPLLWYTRVRAMPRWNVVLYVFASFQSTTQIHFRAHPLDFICEF